MRITSALGICIFVLLPISQAYASDFAPSAPGASVLTSQSQSVKVDDASGALRQRVALNIPPGRNGLQPDIALEYNSQNTDVDSIVGYGWSLSIPYIARLNKTGSQNLYDPTNAFFTSSMDGELTTGSTTSPYAYRARVDTGAFLPYTYSTSTNSWIVYDKTGTRYLFGTTTQAQQSATTSPSNVYKWMLEEVRDTNDNFVRYTYLKDGNQIYPYQIFYTGSGASDGPGTITFATSTRPDTYTSYKTGFKVWTNYRISEITAAFNGSNVRRFTLSYTTGHNGYRSLLSSIQETGWDEDANATTLPPMTFSYASSTSAFIAQSGSPTVNGQGWIITDLNGDGLNDKATLYVQNGAKYGSIYHGGTASQGDVVVPETLAIFAGGQTIEYPARERGVRILDINADGKADIVRGEWNYTTQTATTSLYLNAYSTSTGYSFPTTTTSQVDIPRFSEDGTGTIHGLTSGIFADLNGTGLPSFVQRVDGHFNIATYLADGLGWSPATTTLFSAPQSFPISATSTATSSQMVDLNADGLADWVYSDTTSTYALLNTGRGWEESPDTAWTIATTTLFFAPGGGPTAYYDRGIRFADINGDGLPDFLHLYTLDNTITSASVPQPDAGTYNDVLLNTGHGWATTTAYGTLGKITTARAPAGVWSGSFEYNEYGNWNGNGQQNQDVLQTILYPKGGSTTVTYGYTAQSGTNPELPYSLLVVTSVINRDSRGGSEETIYAYAGGKQYVADGVFDRKFAGFSTITKTRANSITTTYYHQADSANTGAGEQNDSVDRIGQPFREDIADSSGTIVERTFFRWDADTSVSTTTTSSTTTFPTSPVSYWKVDEASGTAFDSVIANHLTNNNTATYSSGRINNGVNLVRASSQYLSITNASQIGLGVSGDFTVAGWVKFSTIPTSGIAYALASKRNNQSTYTNPGFFSYLYHTGSALKLYGGFDEDDSPGNGETAGMASWSPSTDTWYHVAMVVDADASTITFYVDASPLSTSYDTTNATSVGSNTKPFNLGADNPGGTPQHFMNGSMDEWGFWDRALTSNEVSELYNNGSGLSYGASVRTSTTTLLHLGAKMVQSFDGTTHTDKATTYQYATSTQNLIRTNDYGQVSGNSDGTFTDTGSDSRTTTVSYAASSTVNLVVPREKTLFSNSSETTTNVRFYYDNLSLGSVNIGNQTKEESWITGSGYASTTKTYNAYGLVATSTDARGNATSYAYDTFNLYPATTTNALIQQTGFQYNYALGKVKRTADPNGLITATTFDGVGRPTLIRQSSTSTPSTLETKTAYTYTDSTTTPSLVRATEYLNAASTTDTYSYFDGLGRLVQERRSTENTASSTVTDRMYDSAGMLSTQSLPYFSAGTSLTATTSIDAWLLTTFSYDALGRLATTTNTLGTIANRYGGWIATTTDANGNVVARHKDAYGNLARVDELNPTATSTLYTYDAANNLTSITDAAGNVRNFTYDGLSRRLTARDLHAPSDGTYGTWLYAYDLAGNIASTSDPKSQQVDYTYDALNRPLTENYTGQAGTEVTYTYDSCTKGIGRLCTASSTDALLSYTYDVLGRTAIATTTIGGTAYAMNYGYDRQGNQTALTYPDGRSVSYFYGNGGLLDSIRTATSSAYSLVAHSFQYAPTRNATSITFGNGLQTTSTFDATKLYRLSRLYTGGAATTTALGSNFPTSTVSYWDMDEASGSAFDSAASNHLTNNNTVTYSSGKLNNAANFASASSQYLSITNASQSGLNPSGSFSVSMWVKFASTPSSSNYYQLANKFDRTGAQNSGYQFSLYNNGGTLNLNGSFQDGSAHSTQGHYNWTPTTGTWYHLVWTSSTASSTMLFYVNGAPQTTTYDAQAATTNGSGNSHVFAIGADTGSASPQQYADASIDEAGFWNRALSSTDVSNLYNSGAGLGYAATGATTTAFANVIQDLSYTYDANGNITALTDAATSTETGKTLAFNYDALNRLTFASTTAASSTPFKQSYAYNALGNILQWASSGATTTYAYAGTSYANPHAPTTIGGATYSYDNNGNLTGNGTWTYTWDYKNRILSSSNGTATTYGYDANGSRVTKTTSGVTTRYPQKYFEVQGASTTAYIFGGDTLLATIDSTGLSTTTRYIHPDHLGSTGAVTNANGSLLQSLDYYPYGSKRIEGGSDVSQREYIGQMFDEESDLSYLNARYYEGSRGQFLSEDPVHLAMGDPGLVKQLVQREQNDLLMDPQQLNSYSYARANPILLKDPDGKLAFLPLLGYILAGYSAAQIGVDAYDAYNTNVRYGGVFTQAEATRTNFKLGYDAATAATGLAASIPRVGMSGFADILNLSTASLDVLDQYGGSAIYKQFNEQRGPFPSAIRSARDVDLSKNRTIAFSNTAPFVHVFAQGSTHGSSSGTSPSGSNKYTQLVSSLTKLVSSLSALVTSLSSKVK